MPDQDIRIYNLFPRLYDGVQDWWKVAQHARNMGFDTLYLNPIHQTGSSDSIYAIRDYDAYDEAIFPKSDREQAKAQVQWFLSSCRTIGMRVLYDLVINHTAIDSPLVTVHPEWYEQNEDGSIQCAGTFTIEGDYEEWKDCAKLDYRHPQNGLWEYIVALCQRYMALGFAGFRCDVAAKVPARFWRHLITELKKEYPQVIFAGEAFLAAPEQIHALAQAGFQYIFNSACWWDYKENWLVEQNNRNGAVIAAIAFPENHDTCRCMVREENNLARVRQRLRFTGILSSGWMITSGFEYGFKNPIHVCHTRKADWEHTQTDLTEDIRTVMRWRDTYPVFRKEGELAFIPSEDRRVTLLSKTVRGQQALLALNRTEERITLLTRQLKEKFPYSSLPPQIVLEPYDFRFFVETIPDVGDLPVNTSYCIETGGEMALRQVPIRALGWGEALVEILACGICGSDYREMRHGRFYWKRPDEGGHEWTGRIVALLPPENGLSRGDLVALRLPRQGSGMVQGGGFSRYAVVKNTCLFALEPQDDPICSAMTEPLAVAIHGANMIDKEGEIAVVGSGTLALLMERVLGLLRPSCHITLVYKYDRVRDYVAAATRCCPFPAADREEVWDTVIECSGAGENIPLLQPSLRRGGQMLLMGIYGLMPSLNLSDVMFRELRIQGSFLYDESDFSMAAQFIRSGAMNVKDLIQMIPFTQAQKAFSMPSRERIKVILDHSR